MGLHPELGVSGQSSGSQPTRASQWQRGLEQKDGAREQSRALLGIPKPRHGQLQPLLLQPRLVDFQNLLRRPLAFFGASDGARGYTSALRS